MEKIFKIMSRLLCVAVIAGFAVACDDDDDETTTTETTDTKTTMLEAALEPYVDNVIATYKGMAENSILMADACAEIQEAFEAGTLTSSLIEEAGGYWTLARDYWEKSEAWLFDAVADYNIDPHIDSWPLDQNAMDDLLEEIRNGKDWSIDNNVGYGLLGFHAVEYMLYELDDDEENSLTHSTDYTSEELVYLVAVAEDLRNQSVLAYSAWAGWDNITDEMQEMLEEAELEKDFDYGYSLMNPGQGGSKYKTVQAAAEAIIQGIIDIADEVGNTKIGTPCYASTDEDRNYIESPYALNSIVDFVGNIVSIQRAYEGAEDGDASISDYIAYVDSDLDTRVKDAIEDAIDAISAIDEPFAKTATGSAAENAVEVVGTDLVDVFEEVMTVITTN